MLIKSLDESCFLIQLSSGRRLLLDPMNLPLNIIYELNPSVITFSHNHLINNNDYLSTLKNANIVNYCGKYNFNNILLNGYLTYHDYINGAKRGENIIYSIEADNLKICHLGHLGHILSNEIISQIFNIDLLFIPIGGHFTINSNEALYLINRIKPKYIIPMYYRTFNSCTFLDSPKNFYINSSNVNIINTNTIDTNTLDFNTYMNTLIITK